MEMLVERMERKEMVETFQIMMHNFVHLNELPQDRVVRAVSILDVRCKEERDWAEQYIKYTADFLQLLSNEVRRGGQEALQRNLALHQRDKSAQDSSDIGGR